MIHLTEEQAKVIFELCGFEIKRIYALQNRYRPTDTEHPWWLMATDVGNLIIGTRKRVIHVEWYETGVDLIVTEDEVTKDMGCVHAYSVSKLVEYLTALRQGMNI